MMRCFLLFLLIWCSSLPTKAMAELGESVSVESIRVGRISGRTRVVLDLTDPVEFVAKKMESPARYVVELDGIAYAPQVLKNIFAKTSVTDLSISPAGDAGYSLTFILVSDTIEAHAFSLLPFQNRGHRLVFDFLEPPENLLKAQKVLIPNSNESSTQSKGGTTGRRLRGLSSRDSEVSQLSGTWEHEWSYVDSNSSSQKFESVIEPRWDERLNTSLSLTAIFRARVDAIGDLGPDDSRPDNYSAVNGSFLNDKNSELSLRELYLDFEVGDFYWRLGKQQVVWGQADGVKVLDVVNPQSFREFILDDFDDSRIPLWTVKLEYDLGDSSNLELLWLPDTSYHEFAEIGSPYFTTSPKLLPNLPVSILLGAQDIDKPDDPFSDGDAGFRLTGFWGGWDVSLNYLHHYHDTPVYYQDRLSSGEIELRPEYERNNLVGGTLSNAFGDVTIRAEVVYNSDTFNLSSDFTNRGVLESAEVSSVLGLDWQASSDTLVSTQWFYSHLLDYEENTFRDEREQLVSLLLQRDLNNAAWQLRLLSLYSLNDKDSLVQLKLTYWFRSSLEVWLGADFFGGKGTGVFGQFKEEDRVLLGFKFGF